MNWKWKLLQRRKKREQQKWRMRNYWRVETSLERLENCAQIVPWCLACAPYYTWR